MSKPFKFIAVVIGLVALVSTSAFAGTAFWTGRREQVMTITHEVGWKCEYNFNGQLFWKVFKDSDTGGCPRHIEVE